MGTRLACLFLVVCAGACNVGSTGDDGGDDGTGVPGEISGSVSQSATWSGTVTLVADATIEPNVTITVAAGTMFLAADSTKLTVRGTLQVDGVAGQDVSILPVTGAVSWAGIVAESGGVVDIAYATGMDVAKFVDCKSGATCSIDHANFTGVGYAIWAGGTATVTRSQFEGLVNQGVFIDTGDLTITDSVFLGAGGDTIVQSGGSLDMSYSAVGNSATTGDHCAMHVGAAGSLSITYSNIEQTSVALMIGNTDGAVFNYNNFLVNSSDVDPVGPNTAANFQHNYWDAGVPAPLAGFDFANPEAAPVATAGPRPE
jgi:hypothetical protein